MSNQILIYTPKSTNRILYVLNFIWKDFSGLELDFTNDRTYFQSIKKPKINCSNNLFEFCLNLSLDEILLENHIHQQIDYQSLTTLGKIFYWLSRYEEYIATENQFDEHHRFLGSNLDYSSPIVDELIINLQKELKAIFPEIELKENRFKQINTHDVDFTWKYLHQPLSKQILRFGKNLLKLNFNEIQQQISILTKQKKDPYDQFNYLKSKAEQHQIETIFFWLLADKNQFDKNIDWTNQYQKNKIIECAEWAKIGIHPSYASNEQNEFLTIEINRLEEIIQKKVTKSRQHYIRLNFPKTYHNLIKNKINEDFTMGFAHKTGFRAGTSHAFFWFDLEQNVVTNLKIYPFILMDVTLRNYLKLSPTEATKEIADLKQKVKAVNGNFITLFHQSNFSDEWQDWKKVYESSLE